MNLLEEFKAIPPTHIALLLVVLVLFAAFGFKPNLTKMWNDSTKYDNGKYAVFRLTKAMLFMLGFTWVTTSYITQFLVSLGVAIKELSAVDGFTLIGLGTIAQGVKEAADAFGGLQDRRTKDDAGNPLVVPASQAPEGEVPPPLMPQESTPENCG